MPSWIRSRLKLSSWCCSSSQAQEVPTRKTLKLLSPEQIMDSLNESSVGDLKRTIALCCRILKNPKQMSEEQMEAILKSLSNIIKSERFTTSSASKLAGVIDRFIKKSEMFTIKILAMKLEVSLASWIPCVVASNIVSLFNTGVIHHSAVAYMITELVALYAPGIHSKLPKLLKGVIHAMRVPSDLMAEFWLCRALSSLAKLAPSTHDRLLLPLFRSGYWTSKLFYNDNKSHTTPEDVVINVQFLITLGSLASILPPAVLGSELLWISAEIRELQQRLPRNTSAQLIEPLAQFIQVATCQGCSELISALPTLLSTLHQAMARGETSEEGQDARVVPTGCFAFLACSHPSMVYGFINDALRTPDTRSRVGTLWLLCDLLSTIEFSDAEAPYYKNAFFQVYEDENNEVILTVLDLLSDLIDKECFDRTDKAVVQYLANHCNLSTNVFPIYSEETNYVEEDDEKSYIRDKSFEILLKLHS
ncbi:maestro heat-like repeat-containing protein family member 1 [Ambystoma mexicanum]|uniref:maestro heat-like repeat-containing protein family member 1 n=1 Tax=Ambystoma mexicanum TaxID=8296 RepID=UPI0037E7F708